MSAIKKRNVGTEKGISTVWKNQRSLQGQCDIWAGHGMWNFDCHGRRMFYASRKQMS